VYRMNWTPCGALPWLARVTSTRPPFEVFGAWKLAVLPCSPIDTLSAVGFGLLLPPQPATSAAAPSSAHSAAAGPIPFPIPLTSRSWTAAAYPRRTERRSVVERERRQHHVDRDQGEPLERLRLAVAGDLPDRDRGQGERADVDRRQAEGEVGGEQVGGEHQRREEEGCDLGDRVLHHRDRQVGLALGCEEDPGEVLHGVAGDRDDHQPGEGLRDPERLDRRIERVDEPVRDEGGAHPRDREQGDG